MCTVSSYRLILLLAFCFTCKKSLSEPNLLKMLFDPFNFINSNKKTSLLNDATPEQIHIAYGNLTDSMIIMWATKNQPTLACSVRYGLAPNNYTLAEPGVVYNFVYSNRAGCPYHYRAVLPSLELAKKYSYFIECDGKKSSSSGHYEFLTNRYSNVHSVALLVYADMGRIHGSPSLERLKRDAKSGNFDCVIHAGDFAYNLDSDQGKMGDDFMNRIEDIAARIPYMTAPGNREMYYEFMHYRVRFGMPNCVWPADFSCMWYSFNLGPVHFISYSSEVYYPETGVAAWERIQYEWLRNDLEEAAQLSNRSLRPWIVAFGHRPMYCSNMNKDDCTHNTSKVRDGLEDLFYTHGVDLIIQGHEHSYERHWPVFNKTVAQFNYTNPKAPVHVLSGSPGCNEREGYCFDPILGPRGEWSAFRAWLPGLYGYGRLRVYNATHLHWEQVLAVNGQILDEFWITQDYHVVL